MNRIALLLGLGWIGLTLAFRASAEPPPEITGVWLEKSVTYQQAVGAGPALASPQPFGFAAVVEGSYHRLVAARVRLPDGQTQALAWETSTTFGLHRAFGDAEALDAAYPPGPYAFDVLATNEWRQFALELPRLDFPAAPHLSNFEAAQACAANADFTLAWDAFGGAGSADFVTLQLVDPADGREYFGRHRQRPEGALPGRATQAVIPAGSLPPDYTLNGTLRFVRLADTQTGGRPEVAVQTLVSAATRFQVRTARTFTGPDVRLVRLVRLISCARSGWKWALSASRSRPHGRPTFAGNASILRSHLSNWATFSSPTTTTWATSTRSFTCASEPGRSSPPPGKGVSHRFVHFLSSPSSGFLRKASDASQAQSRSPL